MCIIFHKNGLLVLRTCCSKKGKFDEMLRTTRIYGHISFYQGFVVVVKTKVIKMTKSLYRE